MAVENSENRAVRKSLICNGITIKKIGCNYRTGVPN
jgi:hypothetical protein